MDPLECRGGLAEDVVDHRDESSDEGGFRELDLESTLHCCRLHSQWARSSTPSGTVDGDSRLYRFTDRIPASFDMIKAGQVAAIGTISKVQLS